MPGRSLLDSQSEEEEELLHAKVVPFILHTHQIRKSWFEHIPKTFSLEERVLFGDELDEEGDEANRA